MGKKGQQDEVPNPSSVTNRDILQRLNFLYQASTFLQSVSEPPLAPAFQQKRNPSLRTSRSNNKSKATAEGRATARRTRTISTADLAKSYVRSMRQIGQKATVRMDPSVKRTLCRGCDGVLVPGISSTIRVNPCGSHGQVMTTTCRHCGHTRRIPAPPIPGHAEENPSPNVGLSESAEVEMAEQPSSAPARKRAHRKRTRKAAPRLPPLFEREGHVVFRGNEQIIPPPVSRV
ncbi:RNAse P Rpr2/Rpp21/SNM1 subunit domain-containing protein [Vararia minispora EC-137]|uniref:RNAse P Rpr2/Rpp21/SNM1 subunit domain-containing protein n=1 Tax=Vararia minispora EC-137 TaxID=1314806 RepID=A0ACB8QDQ2_9AGAM|nr:RNAse P Rpr2/Rpp21/SNM1 subunit domain-containing protein [Vararia minispora EC-137]